jgi:hypothetical protein
MSSVSLSTLLAGNDEDNTLVVDPEDTAAHEAISVLGSLVGIDL